MNKKLNQRDSLSIEFMDLYNTEREARMAVLRRAERAERALAEMTGAALAMYAADHEYGCGFYNHPPWRKAYLRLQTLVGYSQDTSVYDSSTDMLV